MLWWYGGFGIVIVISLQWYHVVVVSCCGVVSYAAIIAISSMFQHPPCVKYAWDPVMFSFIIMNSNYLCCSMRVTIIIEMLR